jgi:hypothetical protein
MHQSDRSFSTQEAQAKTKAKQRDRSTPKLEANTIHMQGLSALPLQHTKGDSAVAEQ